MCVNRGQYAAQSVDFIAIITLHNFLNHPNFAPLNYDKMSVLIFVGRFLHGIHNFTIFIPSAKYLNTRTAKYKWPTRLLVLPLWYNAKLPYWPSHVHSKVTSRLALHSTAHKSASMRAPATCVATVCMYTACTALAALRAAYTHCKYVPVQARHFGGSTTKLYRARKPLKCRIFTPSIARGI